MKVTNEDQAKKIIASKVESIGFEHPSNFSGRGVSGSKFDDVAVGVGSTEKEAMEEALELLAQQGYEITDDLESAVAKADDEEVVHTKIFLKVKHADKKVVSFTIDSESDIRNFDVADEAEVIGMGDSAVEIVCSDTDANDAVNKIEDKISELGLYGDKVVEMKKNLLSLANSADEGLMYHVAIYVKGDAGAVESKDRVSAVVMGKKIDSGEDIGESKKMKKTDTQLLKEGFEKISRISELLLKTLPETPTALTESTEKEQPAPAAEEVSEEALEADPMAHLPEDKNANEDYDAEFLGVIGVKEGAAPTIISEEKVPLVSKTIAEDLKSLSRDAGTMVKYLSESKADLAEAQDTLNEMVCYIDMVIEKTLTEAKGDEWIILDWAGNYPFGDSLTFGSMEDAEDHLAAHLGDKYETDREEYHVALHKGSRDSRYLDPKDPRAGKRPVESTDKEGNLRCDMVDGCNEPITHIDHKGYIYCNKHGMQRKLSVRTRKLRPSELKQLKAKGSIASYDSKVTSEASDEDAEITDQDVENYLKQWVEDGSFRDFNLAMDKGLIIYAAYLIDSGGALDPEHSDNPEMERHILKMLKDAGKKGVEAEREELLKNVEVWVRSSDNNHAYVPYGDVDYFVSNDDMRADGYEFERGYDENGKEYDKSVREEEVAESAKLSERHGRGLKDNHPELDEKIKDVVQQAYDALDQTFELGSQEAEEIEHKTRDGFISSNDGGYQAAGFSTVSYLMSTGHVGKLPDKAEAAVNEMEERNLKYAVEALKEKHPEELKGIPDEKINYRDLQDMGKDKLADELDDILMNMNSEDTVMFQVRAMFDDNEDDSYVITVQAAVNWEAPYHRPKGAFEDYYQADVEFTAEDMKNPKAIAARVAAELKKGVEHLGVSGARVVAETVALSESNLSDAVAQDLAATLLGDTAATAAEEQSNEEVRRAFVRSGEDVIECMRSTAEELEIDLVPYLPVDLIKEIDSELAKKSGGKASLEALYQADEQAAHRLVLNAVGHGVSPFDDDCDGADYLTANGITQKEISSLHMESPHEKGMELVDAVAEKMGATESKKKDENELTEADAPAESAEIPAVIEAKDERVLERVVNIELPLEGVLKELGLDKLYDTDPSDFDAFGSVSDAQVRNGDIKVPKKYDGIETVLPHVIARAAEEAEMAGMEEAYRDAVVDHAVDLLDGVDSQANYQGETASGDQVSVDVPFGIVAKADLTAGVIRLEITNPEHLWNAIVDGVGMVSPDMPVDEPMSEKNLKMIPSMVNDYYEVYGGKPKMDTRNLSSKSVSDSFYEELVDGQLSMVIMDDAIEAILNLPDDEDGSAMAADIEKFTGGSLKARDILRAVKAKLKGRADKIAEPKEAKESIGEATVKSGDRVRVLMGDGAGEGVIIEPTEIPQKHTENGTIPDVVGTYSPTKKGLKAVRFDNGTFGLVEPESIELLPQPQSPNLAEGAEDDQEGKEKEGDTEVEGPGKRAELAALNAKLASMDGQETSDEYLDVMLKAHAVAHDLINDGDESQHEELSERLSQIDQGMIKRLKAKSQNDALKMKSELETLKSRGGKEFVDHFMSYFKAKDMHDLAGKVSQLQGA